MSDNAANIPNKNLVGLLGHRLKRLEQILEDVKKQNTQLQKEVLNQEAIVKSERKVLQEVYVQLRSMF